MMGSKSQNMHIQAVPQTHLLPFVEQIDIHIDVPTAGFSELTAGKTRRRILRQHSRPRHRARDFQRLRFATSKGVTTKPAIRTNEVDE
jgi:hypothetical protein